MEERLVKREYRRKIVDAGNEMVALHLTVGTWGNVSVRDTETGLIYIKPSGMPYAEIQEDDVVVMNSRMEIVWGHRKPSIEYHLHIAIMNARPDVNSVIHTHPIYSSVFGVTGQDIPGISEDFVQIVGDKIINCKYSLPGTLELAENVVEGLGDRNAVLIPNHGTVCVGADIPSALKVCHVVEKSAQIFIYAKLLGTPHLISEEDIRAMQYFVKNSYGQGK
ncbi:class II aldolase/adducin family protein [Treponema parvum]|uniref:Class II aldolase/adducin family protein n=1 Tax=Treponema parvum TaxID=138851 RepID=A0A975F4E2_9SPIR|nr:class II aldolase/adducin family protein [Treponema parvum]QTQ14246.1 class II aldolase/adducin family protein [Treponema parvum]